jgi:phosphoglycerate dehydrogenase-like enzyme
VAQPVLVAAELAHLPETCGILAAAFDVRELRPATAAALATALRDADAYFATLAVRLTADMVAAAPRLAVVATPSTGLDHLDLDALAARGVALVSLKHERALLDRITATAELAWALVLACARRLPAAFDASRSGRWARDELRGHQLAGKTCGIVGCGRLGSMVADYARAFRMTVLGHDVADVRLPGTEHVSLDELLARSDVVSLHIHLTEANRGLLDRQRLGRMKPGALLVNTSRGAIVDEAAVIESLAAGRLAAYGTDVVDGEWRTDLADHPLVRRAREHGDVVITPHVGGITHESQAMAYAHTARLLVARFRDAVATDGA